MDYPAFRNALLCQIAVKEFKQGGFAATADAGHNLYQIHVPVLNQLAQIARPVDKLSNYAPP